MFVFVYPVEVCTQLENVGVKPSGTRFRTIARRLSDSRPIHFMRHLNKYFYSILIDFLLFINTKDTKSLKIYKIQFQILQKNFFLNCCKKGCLFSLGRTFKIKLD